MAGGMWFVVSVPTENHEKQCLDNAAKKNDLGEGSYQTLSAYTTASTETFSTAHSVEEVINKWKNMRTIYVREKKKLICRSGAGGKKSKWAFMDCLGFLDPYVKERKRTFTNMSIETTDNEEMIHNLQNSAEIYIGENIEDNIEEAEEITVQEKNNGDHEFLIRKSSSKILETIPENETKKESEKNDIHSVDSEHLVYFVDNVPLEKVVKETLDSLGIVNAVWTTAKEGKFHEISFPCEPGYKCDLILRTLITKGIGFRGGSTIGVMPCAIFYQDVNDDDEQNSNEGSDAESEDGSEESTKSKTEKKGRSFSKSIQHKFLKSVTSRLTVAQVVEGVRANANLNFDYVMFVILASIIAAVGLVESSSVILVASMLISPLMGPILAGTFGTVIQDGSLRNLGIKTEIIGLILCLIIGFIFGLIGGPFSKHWIQGDWPTKEMTSRGELRSLWVGILVALPSGAGVALSVLGGNAGSLVGVAISASLLPPAVNAGLLWALSAIEAFKSMSKEERISINTTITNGKNSSPVNNFYKSIYSNDIEKDLAILGVVSLLLTLINILCIFTMAVIVLKIKEVAPHTSVPQIKRFWKQDIKIARDYNKTLGRKDARTLGKQFLTEWANLNNIDPKEVFNQTQKSKLTQIETLKDLVQDVEADDVYQTVMRHIPNLTPQPLSQCLNLITWPAPEMPSSSSRPSLFESGLFEGSTSDVVMGKDSLFKTPEYHHYNHMPFTKNKINALSKKPKLKAPAWSVDSMNYWPVDSYSDIDIKDRRKRNPSFLVTTVDSCHSEGFLRPSGSLQNPYTLWPSSWMKSSRFVVTPVAEMERTSPRSYLGKGLPSSNFDTVTTC